MTYDPLTPIFERRSCRAFRPDPIPKEDLDRLLESMRMAPSAGNCQPWRFLVVQSKEEREALAVAAFGQDFIAEAPIAIVVCGEAARSSARYESRGRDLYVLQDTAAATENLLIAATALGYGSCWIGAFDEAEAARALSLPQKLRPVAIVPIGKAAKKLGKATRRPMSEIVEMR
jgi:nitroreductase